MPGQPLKPEMDRAWENYFQQRGGEGTTSPAQILPVVIMDDTSQGPYSPCIPWMAGDFVGALAANYSYLGIINSDSQGGGQAKSALVVDEIIYAVTGGNIVLGLILPGSLVLADIGLVERRAMEPELQVSDRPRLGNAKLQQLQSVVALGGVLVPGSASYNQLRGPWVLGPQSQLVVRGPINNSLYAFFRGRYYPAP